MLLSQHAQYIEHSYERYWVIDGINLSTHSSVKCFLGCAVCTPPKHVLIARTLSPIFNGNHSVVQVTNDSLTAATIHQGTKLGGFTPKTEVVLVESQQQQQPGRCSCKSALSTILDIDLIHSPLSASQKDNLLALLHHYRDLFATTDGPLGCTAVAKHAIYTEGPPIHQLICHQPVALQNATDSEVQKMLKQRVIQPSFSPWSLLVMMVKKTDDFWRFCIDYHKLNEATAYSLPWVDATLESLAGSIFFKLPHLTLL